MTIKNAVPRIFYGLHFQGGVAEYKDQEPSQMIYISSDTAKLMDKTYAGKPVYVMHNTDAKHDDVQNADGVVVESFYNKPDGNNWVKFIVYTDEALEVIRKNWKLSNAYDITAKKGSGVWHGIDYDYEVSDGDYDHLAIVPNPRYADSIILSPEDFKQYNLDKEAELARLANSKGDKKMKFNFFKKEKVTNSDDLGNMSVILPKTKTEVTIAQLINEADEKKEEKMNMGSKVDIGNGDEMSVKELVNFYKKNMKKNEEDEDSKENEEDEEKENMEEEEEGKENKKKNMKKKKNEEEEDSKENEDEEDKENEDEEDESADEKQNKKQNKKKNSLEAKIAKLEKQVGEMNFNSLSDAPFNARGEDISNTIETSSDQVARGKSRYGN